MSAYTTEPYHKRNEYMKIHNNCKQSGIKDTVRVTIYTLNAFN